MIHSPYIAPFGVTPAGEAVSRIALNNGTISCEVITYGATLRTLFVPDRSGNPVDVVLGYDTLEEYRTRDGYLGATIGRFANRIADGRFTLNGKDYTLACNNGPNHLHGGNVGFSHRVWDILSVQADRAELALTSPDGEEGYPGTLQAKVTYVLCGSALEIRYEAISDRDTPCSLTNHSYFNLGGHNSGDVLRQAVSLAADCFTPSNAVSIPYGTVIPVAGTPMDLRTPTAIGLHIDDDDLQLRQARGYDHNYVINGTPGTLRPAATASCAETGISLSVSTTLPGVQLYTANFIAEDCPGKGGCHYGPRHAFCLETQFFPDTPNQPDFPSAILREGETYRHTARFTFSALPESGQ